MMHLCCRSSTIVATVCSLWREIPKLAYGVLVLLLLCSSGVTSASAQQRDPVAIGKEAISDSGNVPWYDAQQDQFAPPPSMAEEDADGRESQWIVKPRAPQAAPPPTGSNWSWDLGWLNSVPGWLFLGVLLFVLVGLLLFFLLRRDDSFSMRRKALPPTTVVDIDEQRLVDLPFQIEKSNRSPLEEAEHWMKQGNYEKAIIFLFGYQLLSLDANRAIILQRGKTNRTYLRELKNRPDLRGVVYQTMICFEQVFFGRYSLPAERFMECWNALSRFHQLLPEKETTDVA